MRRVALVRRRDGEVVPFDEAAVVESVHHALLAAGREDRLLAGEIAAVVTLFLEKTYFDEVPTVAQVEEMVERVLLETGHASAAKAFILHREREGRQREVSAALEPAAAPALFDARVLLVDDPAADASVPFEREALARRLAADGTVSRDRADAAAAAVEARLRALGALRVSSAWLRALAEVELLAAGEQPDLRRRPGVLLDAESLSLALVGRGDGTLPRAAAARLGESALRAHTLADLLPADVARAHLDGDLHVHGLTSPSSLFALAVPCEDVRRGRVPGSATRAPEAAAISARRFAATLGRSVRTLTGAAEHVSLLGVARAFGVARPSRGGDSPEDVDPRSAGIDEEAWLVLAETARAEGLSSEDPPRIELDLTPGADPASLAFAAASLRALLRGNGLPPGPDLPAVVLGLSEDALGSGPGREVAALAAELALRGDPVRFHLLRGEDVRGTSAARPPRLPIAGGADRREFLSGSALPGFPSRRETPGDRAGSVREPGDGGTAPTGASAADRGESPESRPFACGGRVTIHLPRLARAAGQGQVDRFLRSCDRMVELAAAAHRARRAHLARAAAPGGPLEGLFRAARGREPLLTFGAVTWSVGILGMNEALLHLTGAELHEADDAALRTAQRILSYLSLRVREAGLALDATVTLDADEDARVARRFWQSDLRSAPDRTVSVLPGPSYTAGVRCRAKAPVDALLRLDREDALQGPLATASARIVLPRREAGGPEGVVALLAKCVAAGNARQAEVAPW